MSLVSLPDNFPCVKSGALMLAAAVLDEGIRNVITEMMVRIERNFFIYTSLIYSNLFYNNVKTWYSQQDIDYFAKK